MQVGTAVDWETYAYLLGLLMKWFLYLAQIFCTSFLGPFSATPSTIQAYF